MGTADSHVQAQDLALQLENPPPHRNAMLLGSSHLGRAKPPTRLLVAPRAGPFGASRCASRLLAKTLPDTT